ncbi:hypothetical protein [Pseudomonas akapageensis]|uniref:hypothetical protein n=1 Tax=Pseudomonas akapageensis TaxID=2609961 RepID=UPI001409D400|nr:hypothetical protein [Pseudomonas akapageensis]
MKQPPLITRRNLLVLAAATEFATGLALLLGPGLLSDWLLGITATDLTNLFARCFGLALLALGMACWPGPSTVGAARGMLFYNAAIVLYLAYLGLFVSHGVLLWPAVAFHLLMSLLLGRTFFSKEQ